MIITFACFAYIFPQNNPNMKEENPEDNSPSDA
jgi:hypothetical protein